MSTNRMNESTLNGFDISAAALHVIAMTLMCRKSGLPHLRLHGGWGIFSHPELQKVYASNAAVCSAFGGSLWFDVRWHLVLSGSSKCALDIPAGSFGYPSDGTGAKERKDLGRSAGVGDRRDSRIDTGNPLYGRLLWYRCCNGICVLFLSWP